MGGGGDTLDLVREHANRLNDAAALDELVERLGEKRFVLIGEASHGTHEFYALRAELTKRLIEEKGFCAVAAEADWPDAYRVNRWVRSASDDESAEEALSDFQRFPRWMWRNTVVLDFVQWLRRYNESHPGRAAGFYGVDLYSMYASMEAVIAYLDEVDPVAAERARYRYACFEQFGEDSQAYGYAAEFGLTQPCEEEALRQLQELRQRAAELASAGLPEDEHFQAEQNARLVRNAEEYYRTMFAGRVSSWNLRDRHMTETLGALAEHLERKDGPAKIVVWEHNSHLGDASATQMGESGEWNVGQLTRERWGEDVVLVGFTTYEGTVTAASAWDRPGERKRVRPGLSGSWEELFHRTAIPAFWLDLRQSPLDEALAERRLERAIGVIYLPQSERVSHYFDASLSRQFDIVIHLERTRALEPLEPETGWHPGEDEVPETFPFGL